MKFYIFCCLLGITCLGEATETLCPSCQKTRETLEEVAYGAQNYYAFLANELPDRPLWERVNAQLLQALERLKTVWNRAELYRLSADLSCKFEAHVLENEASFLEELQDLAAILRVLPERQAKSYAALNAPLFNAQSGTWAAFIQKCSPPEDFYLNLLSNNEDIKALNNVSSSFNNIYIYFHEFSILARTAADHPEYALCSTISSGETIEAARAFLNGGALLAKIAQQNWGNVTKMGQKRLKERKIDFEQLVRQRLQPPLCDAQGRPLAFIPNDATRSFFVQTEAGYVYPTEEKRWSVQNMARQNVPIEAALDLSEDKATVINPEQFRGLNSPESIGTTVENVRAMTSLHLDTMEDYLKAIKKYLNLK